MCVCVCVCILEYYSAAKRRTPTICDNMDDLESIMQSEIIQIEKDKYYMVPLTCGI